MITYHTHQKSMLTVPVLHKVVYDVGSLEWIYQTSYIDYLVSEWCKKNCVGAFYSGPKYTKERSIQFEDDTDAILFALRWVNEV